MGLYTFCMNIKVAWTPYDRGQKVCETRRSRKWIPSCDKRWQGWMSECLPLAL